MKLEFARIINFRQYFGEQQVDFSTFGDLNVTVFHGSNGAGKTSFFSAINWCLYGAGVENIGQLVSREAVTRARDGDKIPSVVSIGFIHHGNRYIAERASVYRKSGNNAALVTTDFSLTRTKITGDSENVPNPIGTLNAILPESVRPYFFFDGEKMDDLTRAENHEVESAVRNIMRLPAIERAQEHLQAIEAEYRKEIRDKGSQEIEQLIKQEEDLRDRKQSRAVRKEELRELIRFGRQQIEDIEDRLRDLDGTAELQKRRDLIVGFLNKLEAEEKELLRSIQTIVNRSYIQLLTETFNKSLTLLNSKREKGEIPSGIREQFIADLLEKGTCVCGRPFTEHDDAHQHLIDLLKRTTSSKLENEVLKLSGDLRALINNAVNWQESLNRLCSQFSENKETARRMYAELDDIKRQIVDGAAEEIVDLERNRSKVQINLENNKREYNRIEYELEEIDKQIEDRIKQRETAEKKQKVVVLLSRKEALARKAAEAVAKIKEQFFEQTRFEIEKATKDVFSKLAWKQDHFQDVRLDPDFRIEVIDRWGMPTRKELSAGERQILSLSFITAISCLSGEEAPLVMDTPFGRLSGDHLKAVAENLPILTPQLILFVTDREWDEASKTNLEPKTGAQYDLCFDQHTGCTEIKEICYG